MQNQTFYSFGGKTPIRTSLSKGPVVNATFSTIADQYSPVKEEPIRVIKKDLLVKVQDYTKNISQEIFTPGMTTKHTKTQRFSINHKAIDAANQYYIKGSSSQHKRQMSTKSNDQVKQLEEQLKTERSRRRSL